MRKLSLRSVALITLFAGPVMAADLGIPVAKAPPAAPPPAPVYSWTGCYVGGNVGGGWRRTTFELVEPTVSSVATGGSVSQSIGVVGGADLGCNWQSNDSHFVVGFEGNWTAANFGDAFVTVTDSTGVPVDLHSSSKSLYDATLRVGYAANNWLFYAKGGWAGTTIDLSAVRTSDQLLMGSVSLQGANGFVGGGGIDYGLTQNIIVGIEYDYYGFRPTDQLGVTVFNGFAPENFTGIKHSVQTLTGHIDFLFNFGGGPTASSAY
jgi:outer membrane immunogenic protein